MIEAQPDLWDSYIKSKPDASHFRYAPVRNFDLLDELYGKDRATGSRAAGPRQRNLRWAQEQNNIEVGGNGLVESFEDVTNTERQDFIGIDTPLEELNADATSSFQAASGSTSKTMKEVKKKKTRVVDIVSEEMKILKSGLDAVAATFDCGNHQFEQQLFGEIAKIDGMNNMSRMKVYQVLTEDARAARVFLACPVEHRHLWVSVKFDSSFFDT